MSVHVYHVIKSLGVGGGQSMLFELHDALAKYHSEELTQTIHLVNHKSLSSAFASSYGIQFYTETEGEFVRRVLRDRGDKIVIFHKLMSSTTDFLRPIYNRSHVIIVNHTHTESVSFNRIRNADTVVAVCANMKENLNKMRVPAQIEVILNGVNGYRYEGIEPVQRTEEDVLLTGRINAFNKIKYSEGWVKWCQSIHLPKKMIHEYIGGGGFFKSAKRLQSNPVSRNNKVLMLGGISDFKKKIARLKSWDIFLYEINRNEGLSISVLESLASGVPVVCSNHYGNNEIIKDGVNGFVFRNRSELEHILTELCLDPDLIASMKESTLRHFRDNLDAKITAKKYRDLIERVMSVKIENKIAQSNIASGKNPRTAPVKNTRRKRVAPPPKVNKKNSKAIKINPKKR